MIAEAQQRRSLLKAKKDEAIKQLPRVKDSIHAVCDPNRILKPTKAFENKKAGTAEHDEAFTWPFSDVTSLPKRLVNKKRYMFCAHFSMLLEWRLSGDAQLKIKSFYCPIHFGFLASFRGVSIISSALTDPRACVRKGQSRFLWASLPTLPCLEYRHNQSPPKPDPTFPKSVDEKDDLASLH